VRKPKLRRDYGAGKGQKVSGNQIAGSTKSKQDYQTPQDFISAVKNRFGDLIVDLAAGNDNRQCDAYIDYETNSLEQTWSVFNRRVKHGWLWLNPPFRDIAPWVEKCHFEMLGGARILALLPASVGSNWYRDHVFGKAAELYLNGRLRFVGCKDLYPKDCMLLVWDASAVPGREVWQWREYI